MLLEKKDNRPVFLYDSDCGFCRYWTNYWKQLTGDHVEYRAFEQVQKSSQFVDTDGRVYVGAHGVVRLLSYAMGKQWMLWMYEHLFLFRFMSEFVYGKVSSCRSCAARLTKWFWGEQLIPSSFLFTRKLFLRLLGLVYVIAFISFGLQIPGLIGLDGILPAGEFFQTAKHTFGSTAFFHVPSLAWMSADASFLQLLACIGAALGLVAVLGLQLAPIFFLLWILYLSLFYAGQVFMGFQWDILLLEVGFLSIFFAPTRFGSKTNPSEIVVWLYRFLVFRLIFGSGFVKLASGDPTWRSLSALDFHYFTQPIPNTISWFAHQLPVWFDHIGVLMMFFIQLVLPFFIFAPRRLRFFAAFCFLFLEGLIALTGNYTFFNLLTIGLVFLLFDDQFFRYKKQQGHPSEPSQIGRAVFRGLGVLIMTLFIFQFPTSLRLVNNYGLFAVMTTKRPEIVLEGSMDGQTWMAYEFKYKPGDLGRRPPFVAPHQPRLDWQMWFAALSTYDRNPWFVRFVKKILNGSPGVLALLEKDPFNGTAPKYLRGALYEYEFTTADERAQSGDWWKREGRGLYLPVTQRK